jgi:outer membrane protein OmpA-like peptidoglycan-associated protein
MYDCWLEQEAEGFQYDHIAACRDQFMAALAELEKPFPVAPVPKAAAPEKFLVFFDWDKYVVTPEGRRVVASAAEAFKTSGRATIVATGYTDLSGPPAYNYKLSERRAAAIKAELVRLGVPATSIRTIGRGENDPLVPTADGVREPQNRRVEIQFQGPGS